MTWKVLTVGLYNVNLREKTGEQHRLKAKVSKDGLLHLSLGPWALEAAKVDITLTERSL